MTPEPLFHIGYHKTGTTWMQRRLFKPAFGYVQVLKDPGEAEDGNDSIHEAIYALITGPHRFAYDPEAVRAHIQTKITDPNLVPVISSEIMSGHPFWGGRESYDLANRIHEAVPNARILVTIRAQVPAITSVYMQYVRRGGRLSVREFYQGARPVGYDRFDPIHFEYHHLVGHYQNLFGTQNVLVLTQEQMARDPESFVSKLAAFSGNSAADVMPSTAREGASEAEVSVGLLRRINYFRRGGAGPDPIINLSPLAMFAYRGVSWVFQRPFLKHKLGDRKPVRAVATELFGGQFAASNQTLQKMCPELELPGYEI